MKDDRLDNVFGSFNVDATCEPDEAQQPGANCDAERWERRYYADLERAHDRQCELASRAAAAICIARQAVRDLAKVGAQGETIAWYLERLQEFETTDG